MKNIYRQNKPPHSPTMNSTHDFHHMMNPVEFCRTNDDVAPDQCKALRRAQTLTRSMNLNCAYDPWNTDEKFSACKSELVAVMDVRRAQNKAIETKALGGTFQ